MRTKGHYGRRKVVTNTVEGLRTRMDQAQIKLLLVYFVDALNSLQSSKQRSILALLGIVIGIGSVISMVSVGEIIKNEALRQFSDLGVELATISKDHSKGYDPNIVFRLDDVLKIPHYIDKISLVAPYTQGSGELTFSGRSENVNIFGVTSEFQDMNKIVVTEGRFITNLDNNSFFCVLGKEAAALLAEKYQHGLVAEKIQVGEQIYIVAGVIESVPDGSSMRPYGLNESILIPIKTALTNLEDASIESVMIKRSGYSPVPLLKNELNQYFSRQITDMAVQVRASEEIIAQMEIQMGLFTTLLAVIGSISLIVGGVGIMNVMLVSVTERKKEIGILRAIGARQGAIQTQFISEAIVLTTLGGLIGTVIGMGVSYFFARMNQYEFSLYFPAIILGVIVSCVVGVFFGYYPARQASRLDPIEALNG